MEGGIDVFTRLLGDPAVGDPAVGDPAVGAPVEWVQQTQTVSQMATLPDGPFIDEV